MTKILFPDGSSFPSSQVIRPEQLVDQELSTPMVGIILTVEPSDHEHNLTAMVKENQNGYRHECTVLIMDANIEPNLLLENVVIPPSSHSGVDNFSEDLPRGKVRSLDGEKVAEHFKNQDMSKIDAEWCVVQFVGGSIDKPYISNWWNHPLNYHDPATTGKAAEGNSLTQVDTKGQKYRLFRRINGVQVLVSPEGDVYIDTTEANSKVEVIPKVKRLGFSKGGNIQVDIKSSKQLEFNWNTPVEGLKAGSTEREESKPHLKAPKKPTGDPPARETSRTSIVGTEYALSFTTSDLSVKAQNEGGNSGKFKVEADDEIELTQGSTTVAKINLSSGQIEISGIKVSCSTPMEIGTATDGALKGTTFLATYMAFVSSFSTIIDTLNAKYSGGAAAVDPDFQTMVTTIATTLKAHMPPGGTGIPTQQALWESALVKLV